MARGGRRPSGRSGGHAYPRSARLNETLREIIAEELLRIDDERLEFVTITSIDVDNELNRAHVYFDSLAGAEGDDELVEALGEYRARLQSSIARQIRTKKTPILEFRPDEVIRSAERIDHILRADRARGGTAPGSDVETVGRHDAPPDHDAAVDPDAD